MKTAKKIEWEETVSMYFSNDSVKSFLKSFRGNEELFSRVERGIIAIERVFQLTSSEGLFFVKRDEEKRVFEFVLTENYWNDRKRNVLRNKHHSDWNLMIEVNVNAILRKPEYRGYAKERELKKMFKKEDERESAVNAWIYLVEKEMDELRDTLKEISGLYKS